MTDIKHFKTTGSTGVDAITVFDPSRPNPVLIATSRHPNYARIVAGVEAGDASVFSFFDIREGVRSAFEQITDRVSWDGDNVLWDNEPVNSALSEHLGRVIESGVSDYRPLARFWEKLESNPEPHSKEMAYEWLASHKFVITEDGDVVGYKGVKGVKGATAISSRQGHAFVDGVEYTNAFIPNPVGAVVSMPRSEVAHDPNAPCHTGLHIGDWDFGSTFAGQRTLRVTFNPAHICSVPDHGSKTRVCQYKVEADWVSAPADGSPILRDGDQVWVPDVSARV